MKPMTDRPIEQLAVGEKEASFMPFPGIYSFRDGCKWNRNTLKSEKIFVRMKINVSTTVLNCLYVLLCQLQYFTDGYIIISY